MMPVKPVISELVLLVEESGRPDEISRSSSQRMQVSASSIIPNRKCMMHEEGQRMAPIVD